MKLFVLSRIEDSPTYTNGFCVLAESEEKARSLAYEIDGAAAGEWTEARDWMSPSFASCREVDMTIAGVVMADEPTG